MRQILGVTSLPNRSRAAGMAAVILLFSAACGRAETPDRQPPESAPALVLIVMIDQARADYLDRFGPLLTGGLRRLLDEGVVFTNAHHNHSYTATAPGHAAISTGLYPRHSGIVANRWFSKELRQEVYSVEDPQYLRSPRNLNGPTLGDWFKKQDPQAKVFAASQKDRSAVLLGGFMADGAYWYDDLTGTWTTSTYYADHGADWLDRFNVESWPDGLFGSSWDSLPLSKEQMNEVGIIPADYGWFEDHFPHPLGGATMQPDPQFYGDILNSPFADEFLAQLALTIVREEQMGQRSSVDLLGLSFAALDYVGHSYGPDSAEVLDVVRRLDRVLGDLIIAIESIVGEERLYVGLSSDHGVPPLPEIQWTRDELGTRTDIDDVLCLQQAGLELQERFEVRPLFLNGLYLNDEAITAAGLSPEEIENAAAGLMSRCEMVDRVWTRTQVRSDIWDDPNHDPMIERYHNNYYPGRSPDLMIHYTPYHLDYEGSGTTHGSAHDYDSHVPLIIRAAGLTAQIIAKRVYTVDLAPTLSALLGVPYPKDLDGTDLGALFDRRPVLTP